MCDYANEALRKIFDVMSTINKKWLTIEEEIRRIKISGRWREIVDLSYTDGKFFLHGIEVINFSSNDYLGLSRHPNVVKAFIDGALKFGTSTCASRLVCGGRDFYSAVEDKIAEWKGTETALLFQSGYHANTGVIPALVGKEDIIFSDELNHASIIDGCRLSGAKILIYSHCDIEHLEDLMRKSSGRRKLIITDSVFSMDGDTAPLEKIVEIKEKYGAFLMVDEAHATGIFGREGEGLVKESGLKDVVEIQMGTFSKAGGCFGAYIAISERLKALIINKARSFIFSTALPPPVVSAISASIDVMRRERWRAERVLSYARRIRTTSALMGIRTKGHTQIVPLIFGSSEKTMLIADRLVSMGFFVKGIRPPSVPEGGSRIRVAPSAEHEEDEIERFLSALKEVIYAEYQR